MRRLDTLSFRLWAAVGLSCACWHAAAERFLTVDEAQRVCFPAATRFEAETVRFTPGQVEAIEARARLKVLNTGHHVRLAWREERLLGVLIVDHVLGKHELIDYAVALDTEGAVQGIEILEYRESRGGEIRTERWRAQFKGATTETPLKLNDTIHNISGATLSCRNVTEGVRRVLATYREVVRPRLLALGKLSKPAPGDAPSGPGPR